MDKYTKFILTMIAVGILGLNYHLIGGDIISKAEAKHAQQWGKTAADMHVFIENWPGNCN